MSSRIVHKPGDRYGRLTVIKELEQTGSRRKVLFLCDCGNETRKSISDVRAGETRSCGCLHREAVSNALSTHGMSKHPAFSAWDHMIARCKKSYSGAKHYFYRGIRVCPEWREDPKDFCMWAERSGFVKGLQLDRINNDLLGERAYSPENCRWATQTENVRNRSVSYWWWVNGIRYPSAAVAAKAIGLNGNKVRYRCLSPKYPEYNCYKKYADKP